MTDTTSEPEDSAKSFGSGSKWPVSIWPRRERQFLDMGLEWNYLNWFKIFPSGQEGPKHEKDPKKTWATSSLLSRQALGREKWDVPACSGHDHPEIHNLQHQSWIQLPRGVLTNREPTWQAVLNQITPWQGHGQKQTASLVDRLLNSWMVFRTLIKTGVHPF